MNYYSAIPVSKIAAEKIFIHKYKDFDTGEKRVNAYTHVNLPEKARTVLIDREKKTAPVRTGAATLGLGFGGAIIGSSVSPRFKLVGGAAGGALGGVLGYLMGKTVAKHNLKKIEGLERVRVDHDFLSDSKKMVKKMMRARVKAISKKLEKGEVPSGIYY